MTVRLLAALLLLASPSGARAPSSSGSAGGARTSLDVPIVVQGPERCGQAALEMVLRFYGADSAALLEAGRAYDPALRGSLVTDLAAAARKAGCDATIVTVTPDSLVALLADGVPPIVLYQSGRLPLTTPHFGVVTGWDPVREAFTLNEGAARPRVVGRVGFAKRWRTAGAQALIIRRRTP
jgi:ABC-type bacteriocin/lantibiotic exporter with double-glycine peptidase domain